MNPTNKTDKRKFLQPTTQLFDSFFSNLSCIYNVLANVRSLELQTLYMERVCVDIKSAKLSAILAKFTLQLWLKSCGILSGGVGKICNVQWSWLLGSSATRCKRHRNNGGYCLPWSHQLTAATIWGRRSGNHFFLQNNGGIVYWRVDNNIPYLSYFLCYQRYC